MSIKDRQPEKNSKILNISSFNFLDNGNNKDKIK